MLKAPTREEMLPRRSTFNPSRNLRAARPPFFFERLGGGLYSLAWALRPETVARLTGRPLRLGRLAITGPAFGARSLDRNRRNDAYRSSGVCLIGHELQ